MKDISVSLTAGQKLRAIIGPHAGFRYSGSTAAHAYINLKSRVKDFDRVVLMGPSHKVYLDFVATTACDEWATPLGNLKIDKETVDKLCTNSEEDAGISFGKISVKHEENEHSLEMHLPFIKKVFADEGKPDVKLVPLMVGEIPKAKYRDYAKALLPLFKDERTVFIISSDFCHWGDNFDYYRLHPGTPDNEIHLSIEKMDREGMTLIEAHSLEGFMAYLKETKNTICGRNPIQLLLAILEEAGAKDYETNFVAYRQSEQLKSKKGSSVSYASSLTTMKV